MQKYYVIYSAVTLATRMKKLFDSKGYFVTMMHTPQELSKGGCSYTLMIQTNSIDTIIELSKSNHVKIVAIYKEMNPGELVEVEF